jgi:hypothetical protein
VSYATLTVPGPATIGFEGTATEAANDGLVLTNLTGVDQAPIRATIDDAPQTDGGLVHPFFYGARHLTVEGYVLPLGLDAASQTERNGLMDDLILMLDSILRADGTFAWTPTGQTERSLTVRCDVPVSFTGTRQKAFIFGLVAADPEIIHT